VSSSWHAILSANWAWLPVVIVLSALTYVASAMALIGGVPGRVPWLTVAAQFASSFINRVSPANGAGWRSTHGSLQKAGSDAPASVAAVGVNSLAGAIMHLVLMVVFFALGLAENAHLLPRRRSLPSGSKISADPGGDHCGGRHRPGHPASAAAAGSKKQLVPGPARRRRGPSLRRAASKPGLGSACCSAARR
jgi:hypothetical protein